MKMPMIKHEHLKTLIEDIYLNDNRLTEDFTVRLINELRYSNLIIPAKKEAGTLNFIIYEIDGKKYTSLFTDRDEFKKFYKEDDIQSLDNTFELYQNILKTKDIDGFILNPASLNYILESDLILSIKAPKLNNFTTNAYTADDLSEIYRNLDNEALEKFIGDKNNIGNYEALFEEFSHSQLLTLMLSVKNLKNDSDIISMHETGPLAFMYFDKVGGTYATVYSAKDKLLSVNTDSSLFRYAQLINLSTLVNYVLTEDLDGIILNPDSDNILIPRGELLRNSMGFEKFCNNPKMCNSIFYLFSL